MGRVKSLERDDKNSTVLHIKQSQEEAKECSLGCRSGQHRSKEGSHWLIMVILPPRKGIRNHPTNSHIVGIFFLFSLLISEILIFPYSYFVINLIAFKLDHEFESSFFLMV